MIDKPMFSICVPVYNVADYLDQCVGSLLNQRGEDFEIVLVDDGSTDGSSANCDRYRSAYPDAIRVIHQSNSGLFRARRVAFSAAQGEYIMCVDSDDMLRDDALMKIREAIEETGAEVIFFDWTRERDFSRDRDGLGICEVGKTALVPKNDVLSLLFTSRKINNMCMHAVRRSCIDLDSAANMERKLQYGEDLYWNVPIYECASSFAYVAEPLYYYRPNEKSITHTFSVSRAEDVWIARSGLRDLARRLYSSADLEIALRGISSVDLMQIVDLAQMICLSDRGDKATLLRELKQSDMYQLANDPSAISLIPRMDYKLQIALFRKGRFKSLSLLVRTLSWLYPTARKVRRAMKWA